MSKIASILALTFALVLGAKAQSVVADVPSTVAFDLVGTNHVFTGSTTNTSAITNLVIDASQGLYHSFHLYSSSNSFVNFLDSSLDGTVWKTNPAITLTTNQLFVTNTLEKVRYYRLRTSGSNTAGGLNYIGGR